MTAHPPERLQRLLDEAPFVRLLARTLLAEEADEVVQQTWLQAVRHGGEGVAEPRSWLARIARSVATNLRRRRDRRRRHENEAAVPDLVPSSAELMVREENRAMLVAAVDRLPETLRAVVLLRYFDGLPPRRIAADLGVPVTTVWNRLRQGLEMLRERLDAEHGGQRRAWLLPLVPFAAGPQGMPWAGPALPATAASTLLTGVIVMTMKTKLVAAIAVLLAVSGALVLWATRDAVPGRGSPPDRDAERSSVAASDVPREAVGAAAKADEATQREAVVAPTIAADGTGTLVVHVRYGDDKVQAEGVTMIVWRSGTFSPVEAVRRRTDAAGIARFEALAAGRVNISSDRGWLGKRAEVRSGETTELDYELAVGLTLTGIVVDASTAPVAGAIIEVAERNADSGAEPLATSGPDGRFLVRGAPAEAEVGARAVGHGSSPMQRITGKDGNSAELRLQLGAPAGTVSGIVVDAQNRPVPDAIVRIGDTGSSARADSGSSQPIPAFVRTNEEGGFVAVGVPPGTQPVAAWARDKAPWQGTCEVTANLTSPLRIELGAGATIRGTVRDGDGAAVAQAMVSVAEFEAFAHSRCSTTDDGSFELRGLPAGEVKVTARHDTAGSIVKSTTTVAGTVTPCDLQLSAGSALHGRFVDEAGAPVAGAVLECMAFDAGLAWARHARSGPDGRFTLLNCPSGRLSVTARAAGFDAPPGLTVDPAQGPIEIRLQRVAPASARLRGIVVDAVGQPLPNVRVFGFGPGGPDASRSHVTGPDGSFELGPVPPGSWRIQVLSPRYPPYRSAPIALGAEQTLDLGLVQLAAGGTAAVRVEGDRTGVRLSIVDAAAKTTTALTDNGTALVSTALLPGEYRVLVAGAAVAADAVPFTVRAGEETKVTVKLQPGVRQKFEVVADGATAPPERVLLRVHRGTELVARASLALTVGKPAGTELCLAPGDYVVSAVAGERELARATFTVGATEAAAVRLELR